MALINIRGLGYLSVWYFLVVAHCERMLTTAVCADENFVFQVKSAVNSLDQFEQQFATAFVATRRWRRLRHSSHAISFQPNCFGAREYCKPYFVRHQKLKVCRLLTYFDNY